MSPRRVATEVTPPSLSHRSPPARPLSSPGLTAKATPPPLAAAVLSGQEVHSPAPSSAAVGPSDRRAVQDAVHVCLKFAPRRNAADPGDDGLQMEHDGGDLTLHDKTVTHDGKEDYERRKYRFAHVFGPQTREDEVHAHLWSEAEAKIANGYNATILCYGQTGSGKTYTIEHLLPRMLDSCFSHTTQMQKRDGVSSVKVQVAYLQIYMDTVYNLLSVAKDKDPKRQLGISLDWKNKTWDALPKGFVDIDSAPQALQLIKSGNKFRATNAHALNERSSRSHSLFFLTMTKQQGQLQTQSTLLLVDLAGSERFHKTRATGEVFEEGKAINKALTTLGRVMEGLARQDKSIPYRENILTMYLRETLTNSFFALICCCSSDARDSDETRCTLKFGSVARNVTITRRANDLLKQRVHLKQQKEMFAKTLADITLSHQAELSDLERQVEATHAEGEKWKTEAAQMRDRLSKEMNQKEEIEERLAALTIALAEKETEAEVSVQDLTMIQEKYDELLLEIKAEQQARQVFEDEVQASNEKVQLLQEELGAKSREVDAVSSEREQLTEELAKRRLQLVEVREKLEAEVHEGQSALREREANLTSEIESLDSDLAATRTTLERFQQEHVELQASLKESERQGEEARQQLDHLEDELSAARHELNAKSHEVDTIRAEVQKRRRELEDVREMLEAEVEEGHSALQLREAELTAEIEKLDEDLVATREELQSMQEEHKAVLHNLHAREEEGRTAKESLQKLQGQLDAARQQLDTKLQEVEDVKSERQIMELEVAKRRRELVEVREMLEAEVHEGQSALREREEELTSAIEALDSDLNSTRLTLEALLIEHETLRTDLRRKEQDEKTAKRQLEDAEEELMQARRKASTLQNESSSLRRGRNEAQQLATRYLEENSKISSMVRAKESEVESLAQQAEALRLQIQEMGEKRDADVSAARKLQRALDDVEEQRDAASNDILFLEENIRTVEAQLSSAEHDLADKNQKISSLEKSIQAERVAHQERIQDLQETIDQLEDEQSGLRGELERVNKHKEEIEEAYEKLRLQMMTQGEELTKTRQQSFRVQEHSVDLEVQLATENEKTESLDRQLKASRSKEEEHTQTLQHIEAELATLRESYADNTELIAHLNAQLCDTQKRYSEQVEQTAAAEVERRELQTAIAQYTSQLDTEKTVALKLRSEVDAIQAKLSSASVTPDEVPVIKEELTKTKGLLVESEGSVQQLQSELCVLIDKHEDALMVSESQSRKCAELSQECMNSLRELQEAREEIQNQRKCNEEHRKSIYKAKQETKKMQRDVVNIKKRYHTDRANQAELKKLPVYQARQALLQKQLNRLDVTNKSLKTQKSEEERGAKHLAQQLRTKDRELTSTKRLHANEMRRKKAEVEKNEQRIMNLEKRVHDMKRHMDNQEVYIKSVAGKMKATEHEKEVLKHVLDQNQTFAFIKKGTGSRSRSVEDSAELNRSLAKGGGAYYAPSTNDSFSNASPTRSHSQLSAYAYSRQGSAGPDPHARQCSRSPLRKHFSSPRSPNRSPGAAKMSKSSSSRLISTSPERHFVRATSYDPDRKPFGVKPSSSYAPHVPGRMISGQRQRGGSGKSSNHGGWTSRSHNSFSSPPPPPRSEVSDRDSSVMMRGGEEPVRPLSSSSRSDSSGRYGAPVPVAVGRKNSARSNFHTAASQSTTPGDPPRRFQPPPVEGGSFATNNSFSGNTTGTGSSSSLNRMYN
eukprot:TRINITY_DN9151_c0_g1_i1.p1 TRINITY_DN9151_c0_g1~~TRINITY_DN9151_c0_g1_i1.p1  ORF type:complete len:1789 (+),score=659.24 TRINITY_DN9151_c0_g1_i1:207-5369(+)